MIVHTFPDHSNKLTCYFCSTHITLTGLYSSNGVVVQNPVSPINTHMVVATIGDYSINTLFESVSASPTTSGGVSVRMWHRLPQGFVEIPPGTPIGGTIYVSMWGHK